MEHIFLNIIIYQGGDHTFSMYAIEWEGWKLINNFFIHMILTQCE